jgi:hypothetical protein
MTASRGSDFGVERGSAHRSQAANGIGSRPGKLYGDSMGRRMIVASGGSRGFTTHSRNSRVRRWGQSVAGGGGPH